MFENVYLEFFNVYKLSMFTNYFISIANVYSTFLAL